MIKEEMKKYVTDLTIELINQKTVNYDTKLYPDKGPDGMESPGQEVKVVNVIEKHLQNRHINYAIHAEDPMRPAIIARVGKALPGYRKLMVLLHSDVVPAGNLNKWKFDPFNGFEKGGMIWGRGASDDKGPMASSMGALALLKNIENELNGEFIFASVPDEEVGIIDGLDFLIKNNLINCTDAIVPDIGGRMKDIDVAEKGRMVMKITLEGKQAHGSTPEKGINAITNLSKAILKIEKLKLKFKPHKLLVKPSINIGMISGGSAPNTVAGDASVVIDIRMLPSQTKNGIIKEITKAVKSSVNKKCKFKIEVLSHNNPTQVSLDASIVTKIREHCPKAKPLGIGGGTFCKGLIDELKVNAVGFCPGSGIANHMENEFVELVDLVDFAYILKNIAFDLCNEKI